MTTALGLIGDGAGTPLDQGATTFLFVAALLFGLVAVQRLRNRSFLVLPRWVGFAAAGVAAVAVALAFVLPPILRPDPSAVRPSSPARLAFAMPSPGEAFTGTVAHPAAVPMLLRLTGGRIVPFTSTKLVPTEGHIHLYLDGRLVSMTTPLHQTVDAVPGRHVLEADFVAADHAPFDPPIRASVSFSVRS
jgi:hypothetical protein